MITKNEEAPMFTERLNRIMKIIGARSTDISSIIGCDRSAVDRICKGSRIPKNGGKSASRFVFAVYSFADEHGKTGAILNEIGCSASFSAEQIKGEIMRWLYDGEEPIKAHKEAPAALHGHDKFGHRFSAILDLAEFSNVRFGKLLNIDPSYISRFRNGLRTPVSNGKLTEEMCRVLYCRLKDQNRLSDLAGLINISPEDIHNDADWEKALYSWLFLSEDNTVSSFVVGMVDQIGSFSADIIKPPLPFGTAADKAALSDDQPLYRGMSGLQAAVLRFLGNVTERKEKELYLYSDQNIDWITADRAFQQKWMSLMIRCVTSGVKIYIIHNIERNLAEIDEAIRSWLPLYPSGQIESFYLDGQRNANFSTTLFLCPGYACIYGNNVVGTENESGNYLYETEPERIELHRRFFDTLLGKAHRLIRVCKTADFFQVETASSDITVLSCCPTVFSMPEELFSECFDRSELKDGAGDANDIYKQMKCFFENALLSGHFHECAPLPSDEDLFSGKTYPEFISTPYSPQEFAKHAKNMIRLLDNTKYRFYPLPEPGFGDVQLIISEKSVAVSRLKAPFFT
ncbi:MAG: hypothetical protein PUB00_09775, partial [Clostridiales bacterium]|nr:hypothetical protein [Clostridiales bacterium]